MQIYFVINLVPKMKITLLSLTLALCLVASKVVSGEEWWEYGNVYQIYPRSFQDSDGDGIGDLNGITTRLDYLKYLGATAVWLSPIFQSPMKDFGYDISDYRTIHDEYGTMEDFDRLVRRCKKLGIKLILDFVPNHTSDQHDWFIKSKNRVAGYEDYYVWQPGTVIDITKPPPSNWQSIFKGSAWKLDDTRKDYYYHQFLDAQPDLNYRNPKVVEEMKDILKFWLRKGVDGFRSDAVPYLFENNKYGIYKDEDKIPGCTDQNEYNCLVHTETMDQDETFDMIYQWRAVLDDDEFNSSPRLLMTEAYTSLTNALRFYGKTSNGVVTQYGAHVPFNFELIGQTNINSTASDFKKHIFDWINGIPKGAKLHANWVLGNHDQRRVASRYRPTRADVFNILLKTLPGITITYQGEELGLTDVNISYEDTVDQGACNAGRDHYQEVTRDPARTPFPWDDTKNAGFSTASKTWLPVASDYAENNVKAQIAQPNSHLNIFRRLLLLRTNPTIKYGGIDMEVLNNDKVLVYKREIKNSLTYAKKDVFVIILNLDKSAQTVSLKNIESLANLPKKLEVAAASIQSKNHLLGDVINTYSNIKLEADVGVVLVGTQ